ncbi:MAG: CHASE2 domain-containing serine/threonine-protein kinase [Thermodesulfobacteriota bacterium]
MANRILSPSRIAGAVIVVLFTVLSFARPSMLSGLELLLYDTFSRLSPSSVQPSEKLALVEIDRETPDSVNPRFWPRQRLAELIDRLDEAGVRLIGLIIPFTERSQGTGYDAILEFREKLEAHPLSTQQQRLAAWVRENLERLEQELDVDGRLTESVRRSGKVFLPVFVELEGKRGGKPGDTLQDLSGSLLGPSNLDEALKQQITAVNIALPFNELSRAAAGFGHTSLTLDNRLEGRQHAILVRYRGALIPSMPLRLAAAYKDLDPAEIQIRNGRLRLGADPIQIVEGGMLPRFAGEGHSFPIYSPDDILAGKAGNGLGERIVLVAFGPGTGPSFHTPMDKAMPEGRLAAAILEDLLAGRCVRRPAALRYLEPALILAMGLLALFLCSGFAHTGSMAAAGLAAAALATGFGALLWGNVWLRVGSPAACVILVYLATALQRVFLAPSTSKEAIETNRLLGLSFQSQGLLDLAFDKFKKLPLDHESRDLLYNLGLEFEQKRMTNKALSVYDYIKRGGEYRDLGDRIPRLRESDASSTLGSHVREGNILKDAESEARSKVGRFEIQGELGKGAMGLVYKARDPKINRLLAIKTIRFSDEFEEEVIQEIKDRFFAEAEIAGQLSHPSIVTIYDAGEDGDLTYMAMELLEGKDLDKFITKGNLLPLTKVLNVVARVADALAFAHRANVIHRDIKPANIMLLEAGGVKVTDFGIAKAISSSRTRTGVILGTPNYMSPEQIMGQKIDRRSDIFALGVLFFQLLTGRLPFQGENLSNLLYQITQVRHPSIREINPKIPKACEQIIDKALAKNPADRFQSASEMAELVGLLSTKIEQLRSRKPQRQQHQPKA